MRGLVFLGAGGIATVAVDIAVARGFEIAGFLDDDPARHGSTFRGAPILGAFGLLRALRDAGLSHAVVALGDCAARLKFAADVAALGLEMPTLIHPSAMLAPDVEPGPGTIAMPRATVNAGTTLGSNVILNTACSVDHDCRIGDGALIAPGVHMAGRVTVGRGTWVGIGTSVIEDVEIGANVLIGAGSLVLKDIPDGVVAYGSPAVVVRTND